MATNPQVSNPSVEEVNKLIRKAFGWPYKGTYEKINTGSLIVSPELQDSDKLGCIGWTFLFFEREVGFLAKGGASIVVDKKHTNQARRYATLFEEKFGTEVEVRIEVL